MRIVLIGSSGTIGRHIHERLSAKAEVLSAGRNGADIRVDITDEDSIEEMYNAAGSIDAVVCAAGPAKFGAFSELTEEDHYIGIRGKLMGQVNLVRIGQRYLNDGGSFTLTTGILADDPVPGSSSLALVNGGLHSFAMAAALELPRGLRINVVAPTVVSDAAEKYSDIFPGYTPVSMERVADGYVRSVFGRTTGRILRIT
ncbi:MAG: short chain dehydrogenase [Pyrinomonadaceae bacterium]